MRFSDNFAFPHPVLGINNVISGKGFIKDPGINPLDNSYRITVECNLSDDVLEKLLQDDKVEFLCEATCTNTVYRKCIVSANSKIEFEIPRKQVKGEVEFICLLVAKENLFGYSNTNIHPDYNDFTFDLDKGDVLAYFGHFIFEADIKYEKLKAVSSIMRIEENQDLTYVYTDLKQDKIQVELPSEMYKIYNKDIIGREEKFASVFHSSIVLNALLTALYDFQDHKDYLWAKSIRYRLKNEEELKDMNLDEKENIPEIAQRLLGNPFKRLLEGLENIKESILSEE